MLSSIDSWAFKLACIIPLAFMVRIRQLKVLALFSIVADVANCFGIFSVFHKDFTLWGDKKDEINYSVDASNLPYFFGIAIYCFEGMGTVIPIERSMEHKGDFRYMLVSVVLVVTTLYTLFGAAGYYAFGAATEDIITLNLGCSFRRRRQSVFVHRPLLRIP